MSGLSFNGVLVDGFALHRAEFGVGCHTIVCDTVLGGATFVALAVGEIASDRGKVLVDDRSPVSHPRLTRRIGALTAESSLPHGATVHDVLRTISALRRQTIDWPAELSSWGIDSWLDRRTGELAGDERRAVALAAALGTSSPLAIVLHEPFLGVAALDAERVCARLRALSETAVVVVTVTQPRDAQRLSGFKWLLRPGRVEALEPTLLAPELASGSVSMRIRCRQPRDLVAELALRQEVLAVAFSAASGDSSIWIRGSDARALSVALLQAAHETGASLWSWEIVPTPLPIIVAAHDGSVQGAYERAWHAAQGHPGFWGHGYVPLNVAQSPEPRQPSSALGPSLFAPPPAGAAIDVTRSASAEPVVPVESINATRANPEAATSAAVEPLVADRDRQNPSKFGDPT